MDHLDMLQKLDSNWEEFLDILEASKQHEALLGVLWNSLVLATVVLQHTLQAFYEFKSHVNMMVNNMDVTKEHLVGKIQEKI